MKKEIVVVVSIIVLMVGAVFSPESLGEYVVVDTDQSTCYNNSVPITCPQQGASFYGQDARYAGTQPSYTLSGDGLTVYDNNTELTWQQTADRDGDGDIDADDKLTFAAAQAYAATLNAQNFGGYGDWRVPTIKELYSLILFSGIDVSSFDSVGGAVPFIDTNYFGFGYGDTGAGERIIDSQWVTSTEYVGTVFGGSSAFFGVNFADGRIKGYPTGGKTYYALCVRGSTAYGVNSFVDNGNGTIADQATSLMWQKGDSGSGMNWEAALAYAEGLSLAGYDDWRLPNAKELQGILDYTRSPSTTGSAAIDPVFSTTSIINEAGAADYPCYWTSSTHAVDLPASGGSGVYIAFGRAMGYMNGAWIDVHGAGAQRCETKSGDPADYPYGNGPQGDAVRIYNYVRCVRGESSTAGDLNVYCWNAPVPGDWTYWDAASRNPSPLARDLWVLPAGNDTIRAADGGGSIVSLENEGGDYNAYLYSVPVAGDWGYWDAAARNPSPLARDLWSIPREDDAVAMCGLDTTGNGTSDSLFSVRNRNGDHNVYLWNMPVVGDWTYWDAASRNPSPVARDLWAIPAGDNTELVADGGGYIASLRDENGDGNLYLYEIPSAGDWTYWDAASRNPSPVARDLWFIPHGNNTVTMCGLDTTGDGDNDSLLVVRDEDGDHNLYLWNLPVPGDWNYWDALARNPSPRARDLWLIPGGNDAVCLIPTDDGIAVFDLE